MINATQLPPIDGAMDMDPEQQAMMEEMHYQMEMEGVDEYGQEMEMEPEEQYQEEDQDVGFGDLKAIFRADEMKGKDRATRVTGGFREQRGGGVGQPGGEVLQDSHADCKIS